MRLGLISFIPISIVLSLEKSRHRFVGEEASVRWDIGKFRNYLWESEFTVLSYCSGLKKYLNQRIMYHMWYTYGETKF